LLPLDSPDGVFVLLSKNLLIIALGIALRVALIVAFISGQGGGLKSTRSAMQGEGRKTALL